jgi:hypothetical protein
MIDENGVNLVTGETYDEFVEKFKPKKTTDDCYTPPEVYSAIAEWVCNEYNFDPVRIVRPFYPGGDYENYSYPDGCVVLDNPPFSILSKIVRFYLDNNIKFFLFAPNLTIFSANTMLCNHIITDSNITYENGAKVPTSFVTNLGDPDVIAESRPDLNKIIDDVCKKLKKQQKKQLPKYSYPDFVCTAAMLKYLAKHGQHLKIHREDCTLISRLDSQIGSKKAIFGKGLLLSEKAAAEKAAAEKAAAEKAAAEKAAATKWELSERELQIIRGLGDD